MRWLVALVCAAACAPDYVECAPLFYGDFHALDCEHYPLLCHAPVDSIIVEPDRARAYDLVFLPEGFTAEELPAYRARVRELIEDLYADDEGIVARAPRSFNFHRIDIASASSSIHDADRGNTALAGCLRDDELGQPRAFLATEESLVDLAARANVPETDVAIVIVNEGWGRANAGRSIRIGRYDSARVLTHELGHALFALADEYTEVDACYGAPPAYAYASGRDDFLEHANVSWDPRGAKWATWVLGAEPGGSRHAECIYHPTSSCRMLDAEAPKFCPVCLAEIHASLAAHTRDENDGPPALVVGVGEPVAGNAHFTIKCRDRNAPLDLVIAIDHVVDFTAKGAGALAAFDISRRLSTGAHTIYAECRDAHGVVAHTTLPFDVP